MVEPTVVTTKEILEEEIISKIAKYLYQVAKQEAEEEIYETEAIHFRYHYDPNAPEDEREKGVTVAPGEEVLLEEGVPVEGYITHIIVHVPEGPASLVKFKLLLDNRQIFPRSGWFAVENFTGIIPLRVRANKGQKLALHVINRGSKPHFLSVTVLVFGRRY